MCIELIPEITKLAEQELARREFLPFCHYVMPGFIEDTPQQVLGDALQAVERGEIMRLMISMPPRHGKSVMSTQLFPCWYLGRHPAAEVIQTTYAHPLSVKHSRSARKVFTSEAYNEVFPDTKYIPGKESQQTIAVLRQAADQWGTSEDGQYYAVGLGGGITGNGGDLIIADDLVKNRKEANSPTMREAAWDFWKSTLYTRLSPTGALILVMTRWHPDDVAGRVLQQIRDGDGEDWTVVNMPAIDDQGNALSPLRWPVDKLMRIKAAIGPYEWSALYQGQPVIRGGNMLKVDNILVHRDDRQFPKSGYVRVWDLASTEKERTGDDPDFTAGSLISLTWDADGLEHLWLRDQQAGQWSTAQRDQRIIQAAHDDGDDVTIGIEAVGGYKDTYIELRRKISQQGISRIVRRLVGKDLGGDKVARCTPVEAIIEGGRFHILQAPWNDAFLTEAAEFPDGAHDDKIDSVALAYHELKRRRAGRSDNKQLRSMMRA